MDVRRYPAFAHEEAGHQSPAIDCQLVTVRSFLDSSLASVPGHEFSGVLLWLLRRCIRSAIFVPRSRE
jgi:hypothetical protein